MPVGGSATPLHALPMQIVSIPHVASLLADIKPRVGKFGRPGARSSQGKARDGPERDTMHA